MYTARSIHISSILILTITNSYHLDDLSKQQEVSNKEKKNHNESNLFIFSYFSFHSSMPFFCTCLKTNLGFQNKLKNRLHNLLHVLTPSLPLENRWRKSVQLKSLKILVHLISDVHPKPVFFPPMNHLRKFCLKLRITH